MHIALPALALPTAVALITVRARYGPEAPGCRSHIMDQHLDPRAGTSLRAPIINITTAFFLGAALLGSAAAAKPKPKPSPKAEVPAEALPSPTSSTNQTDMTENPLLTES